MSGAGHKARRKRESSDPTSASVVIPGSLAVLSAKFLATWRMLSRLCASLAKAVRGELIAYPVSRITRAKEATVDVKKLTNTYGTDRILFGPFIFSGRY